MQTRNVKILSTGKYLPQNKITAEDLGKKLNISADRIKSGSGVNTRYYVNGETTSMMGAEAARAALKNAGIDLKDIDCIVSASGVMQQPLPCTAALMQRELGIENSGIPCFDINSTCLSFVTALDTISYMIEAGRYNKVLIISSDITSVALDWEDPNSCTLFGDGAAAVIVGKTPENETSGIIASRMETYSAGADFAAIKGGSSAMHSRLYSEETQKDFLFHMDGKKVYKAAAETLPKMTDYLLKTANLSIDDIAMVVPHQASILSMQLIQKKINAPDGKYKYIIGEHGNIVAASIPMALHEVIVGNEIKRGDKVILLGASAGLSIGVMILEY